MNAKEWQSLAQSMLPAIRMIGEEMGLTGKELDDYVASVQQGKVANKEFLDQLIKYGTSGKIVETARLAMDTWEAFFARIRTAASRLGLGVIESFDQLIETVTGGKYTSTNMFLMDKIIPAIDSATESAKKWIKAHPEQITEFFKTLKNINLGSFIRGYAKSLGTLAKAIEGIAKAAGGKNLGILGMIFGYGGLAGRVGTIGGGLLKGLRHPLAGIGTVALRGFGKIGKGGLFGKLASFFGKKKDIKAAETVAKTIPSVSDTFKGAFNALSGLMKVAGAVLITAGTGWAVTEATKRGLANFKEALNTLKDIEWDDAKKLLLGIGGFIGGSAILGGIIGNVPGAVGAGVGVAIGEVVAGVIASIATGFFDLNMVLVKGGIKNFVESVKLLKEIPDVKSLGDISTRISNAIDVVNEISALFQGRYVDKGVKEGGIQGIGLGTANNIRRVSDVIAAMPLMIENLNKVATMGINVNIDSKMQQISRTLSSVIKFFTGGADASGSATPAFPKISEDKVNSMKNLAEAMGHMKTLVDNLNVLGTIGLNQNIQIKLDLIKRAIKQAEETFTTMFGNITGPGNLNKNTNALADGIRGLRRIVWHLNDLASKTVNNEGITAIVGQIKTALEELQSLSGLLELDIEVKISDKFNTSVKDTAKKIKAAKKTIQDAVDYISKKTFTTTVSVTIKASVNTAGAIKSISDGASRVSSIARNIPMTQAMGGMVYRAKGGSIFKPRGTDTVPAMLTPGEFVHNRRAVNTFGIDFMRKVNNLDMKGAMNELMHRAGNMANVNRGSVVNNTYNNNQRVTINNNGASGAGFTFKSASRFVGAF